MNISFWGNSNFSKLVLEDLIKNNFIPNLVITFSPKEFGRLKELKQNPVEEIAKENNIEIIYFDNFEEQELRDMVYNKMVERSKLNTYEFIKYVKKEKSNND